MIHALLVVLLTSPATFAQSFQGTGTTSTAVAPSSPDYYTVQSGDTLWDISRTFLGNPEYWPRLWSINDYITNPHWIYPGNRIAFRLGSDIEPPQVSLESTTPAPIQSNLSFEYTDGECGADVRFTSTIPSTRYEARGFLADADDVESHGTVYKAKSGHLWLSEGNLIYLKMDDADAYACGDTVSVFRQSRKKVRDPRNRRTKYGSAYEVVAEARIVHKVDDMLSAVVRTSYREIERGDIVGPLMPVHVEVEVREPSGTVAGHIIGRPNLEAELAAAGETVFLNVGRSDGVRVGDSFYVVMQRDEAISAEEDETLPEAVTGRVVVVRVDEYTAVGKVTDSSRVIEDGLRVVQTLDQR